MTDCNAVLIDGRGTVVGRICHIEAAEKGGPRFNDKMTNDQRRSESNLLLLCSAHHIIIDDKKRESEWTVAILQIIKNNHENRFREIGSTLQVAFKHQFRDKTTATRAQQAASLARALKHPIFADLTLKEQRSCIAELKSYAEKLQVVPSKHRELMLSLIQRAVTLKIHDSVSLNVRDVEDAFGISYEELKVLLDDLIRYEVGGWTEEDESQYHAYLEDPSTYMSWLDLAKFCKNEHVDLRLLVIDRDFSILDS